jgi:hypothetical protein
VTQKARVLHNRRGTRVALSPCTEKREDEASQRRGRQTVSGVPPPTKRPRPPEGATAAPRAKPLLAAAFPVQLLLKAA